MKVKPKLHILFLYKYQLNTYLIVDSVVKLSQKNELNRPYSQNCFRIAKNPYISKQNFDTGLQKF